MENLSSNVQWKPNGVIVVDSVEVDTYDENINNVQIRQSFVRQYAGKQVESNFRDSLFSVEELGIETQDFTQDRVTWIPANLEHTKKDVQKALKEVENACIYRVLSFDPILEDGQIRVLKNGLTGDALKNFLKENKIKGGEWTEECSEILLDKIAARQLVVYGENNTEGKDADEPVLISGKKQYRALYFSKTYRPDLDLRVEEKQVMPALELASQEVAETV